MTGRHVEHHSIANDYGFLRWSAIKAVVARRGEVGIGPRRPIGSPADRPTDWCVMFDVRCPTCRLVGVLVCYDGVTTPWSDGAPESVGALTRVCGLCLTRVGILTVTVKSLGEANTH